MVETTCLIDGHVHFYDCYDRAAFFGGAQANFRAAAAGLGLALQTPGWLLFSETAADHYFRRFRDEANGPARNGGRFLATAEACALRVVGEGGAELMLIAGRQIVTAERLEVLALACDAEFADGEPLAKTLDRVQAAGAIAVLPWAFGKWWGRRGALIAQAIEAAGDVCLGDNGGRPRLLPEPGLLRRAAARNIPVLPGSDPLPLAGEAGGAGRLGFVLEGEIDPERPAASLKRWLQSRQGAVRRFGRLESLGRFCRNQLALRVGG